MIQLSHFFHNLRRAIREAGFSPTDLDELVTSLLYFRAKTVTLNDEQIKTLPTTPVDILTVSRRWNVPPTSLSWGVKLLFHSRGGIM